MSEELVGRSQAARPKPSTGTLTKVIGQGPIRPLRQTNRTEDVSIDVAVNAAVPAPAMATVLVGTSEMACM